MEKQLTLATIGAAVMSVFEYLYGSGEIVQPAMIALTLLIVLDLLAGSQAAKMDKSYASKHGLSGVARSAVLLLLPAIGHLIDVITGMPGIAFGALIFGLIYHNLKSMVANAIRAGWGDNIPVGVINKLLDFVGSEMEAKIARSKSRRVEESTDEDRY